VGLAREPPTKGPLRRSAELAAVCVERPFCLREDDLQGLQAGSYSESPAARNASP
jgi:hypothetical protein